MQVIEMTETCISWLKEKFADFDKDGNLLLDAFEQADMFSSAPDRSVILSATVLHCARFIVVIHIYQKIQIYVSQ